MDEYRDEVYLDFEAYPKTEGYELKRAVAYLIDQIISLLPILPIAILLNTDLEDPISWVLILIISGLFAWIMKSLLESTFGDTFGKKMMGLRVIDAYGRIRLGEALIRNILDIVPIILPVLDYAIGMAVARDNRQKLLDSISKTLVIENVAPVIEEAPRSRPRPVMVEPPQPKEKIRLDYRRIRVGHCPRCNAPYRVLDQGDESFSGLWNHRCTWCNHLITEER